ncbi:MAG: ComEC/Rec2 family competence protein [Stappiaceae bacterium]
MRRDEQLDADLVGSSGQSIDDPYADTKSQYSGVVWKAVSRRFLLEQEYGRFFPAFICLFLLGIVCYFAIPVEPSLWILLGVTCLLSIGAFVENRYGTGWPVLVLLFCFVSGFAVAKVRTELVWAPKLLQPMSADITGKVQTVERRESGIRLTVLVENITPIPKEGVPNKIRITVRGKAAPEPKPGNRILLAARLFPPGGAILPSGYDFSRRAYFRSIGATGFSFGPPTILATEGNSDLFDRLRFSLSGFRQNLAQHIVETISGPAGGIAAALITGDRSHVSKADTQALRDVGLSHILAISGMHMALFAGTVFFAFRWLAVMMGAGLSYPVKKWAAVMALLSATAYLIVSGASIPTQRAYIMTLVVLVGILVGRPALTMRSVAIAALLILLSAPETVLEPGFQMSFMAVAALVAVYEAIRNFSDRGERQSGVVNRSIFWSPARFVGALLLTSLIASLATAPFAVFHFHRIAPFGLLANLLAMPIVSIIVMPSAVFSLLLMPFGLEAAPLWAMGIGVEAIVDIAHRIQLIAPDSGILPKFSPVGLVLMSFGLLWLCVWQTAIRFAGILPILLALYMASGAVPPDIIFSDQGKKIAARSVAGELMIGVRRKTDFIGENWLTANGISESLASRRMSSPQRVCDKSACILSAHDRNGNREIIVSQVKSPHAFDEDCKRADIVVTALRAPQNCEQQGAMVLDKPFWQTHGASYLTFRNAETTANESEMHNTFKMHSAYSGIHRPWQPGYARPITR